MTDFTDPQTANLRLGTPERDEAVAQLDVNLRDGRLTEAEFAERSAVVRSAVTRGDLLPVFSDLPPAPLPGQMPGFAGAPTVSAAPLKPTGANAPGSTYSSAYPTSASGLTAGSLPDPSVGRKGPVGGSAGVVAVSLSPFVALILFFITNALGGDAAYSWMWFLLVPVTGAIVYGAGTRDRPSRNR